MSTNENTVVKEMAVNTQDAVTQVPKELTAEQIAQNKRQNFSSSMYLDEKEEKAGKLGYYLNQ